MWQGLSIRQVTVADSFTAFFPFGDTLPNPEWPFLFSPKRGATDRINLSQPCQIRRIDAYLMASVQSTMRGESQTIFGDTFGVLGQCGAFAEGSFRIADGKPYGLSTMFRMYSPKGENVKERHSPRGTGSRSTGANRRLLF